MMKIYLDMDGVADFFSVIGKTFQCRTLKQILRLRSIMGLKDFGLLQST